MAYRARRRADGAAVAVETLDAEYPERQQVARIRREGGIAQRLAEVDGVRKVHAVLPHGSGNLARVCERFESSLDAHLSQAGGAGLPLAETLEIALQLVRTLGEIHARDIVHKALTPALKCHTVQPLHSDYRLVDECAEPLAFNPAYRFQQDRVQQASYALIDAQRLREVHLSVGRLMRQHAGARVPEERLIDIVGHLNAGRALIETVDERLRLAELNLRAGVRARHSSAYETAYGYLQVVSALLPADAWRETPGVMRALALETQQCAYLTGCTEAAAQWIEVLLERAGCDRERGDILATRTRQYATLGRMEGSIHSAIQGLALLGVEISDRPTPEDIAEERRRVRENLRGRRIADLVEAPPVEDSATLTAMRLLMEIFDAAFLSGSGNFFPYLVLKGVNLSLRHGNCPESAFV